MRTIVKPFARRSDPLASRYGGGMTNHSDKLAVATDFHPDDAKTVLHVLIGDALNHPGEHLPIRRVRLRFHEVPCAATDAFLHLCAVHAFEIDHAVEHRGDAALVGFRRRAAPSERPRRFKSQADAVVRIALRNTRQRRRHPTAQPHRIHRLFLDAVTEGRCWNILG
jgi:hypothetical protein